MSFTTKSTFLALAALALAAPAPKPNGVSWTPSPSPSPAFCPSGYSEIVLSNQDCNFDSLNAGLSDLGVSVGAIRDPDINYCSILTSTISTGADVPQGYCGVYFQAFQINRVVDLGLNEATGLPVENGLAPHSGLQYIETNGGLQMVSGTPMITTNFPGSTTKNIDLNSFYVGCIISAGNGAEDMNVGCTLSIAGYSGDDNTVANSQLMCSDTIIYNPTASLGVQQMAFHQVNSACRGLSFYTFQFTVDPDFAVDEGVTFLGLLDDVVITARE